MSTVTCKDECWTRATEELGFAIPLCTAFQEWCGLSPGSAGAAAAAEAYLFRDELDYPVSGESYTRQELEDLGRFAIFGSDPENPFTLSRVGAHTSFSGSQLIQMERLIADADYDTGAKRKEHRERSEFLIGALACQIDEYFQPLGDLPGAGRHIITEIQIAYGLSETASDHVNTEGHWHKGTLLITWGEE